MERKIRILVAKPGLDGHDRGALVLCESFKTAGMEVIYTGVHQTPEMIAEAAIAEDVDVVALSLMDGLYMTLFPEVLRLLREKGADGVCVMGGGIIAEEDRPLLEGMGITGAFGPGTPVQTVVDHVCKRVGQMRERNGEREPEKGERESEKEERTSPAGGGSTAFRTGSGRPVEEVYGPSDLEGWDHARDLSRPGCYPYARGIQPNLYRGKVWTKRFYAGFGRPEDTNRRLKYLLERGQTGIIIVPDRPSQLGIDADHPLAHGNIGLIGYPMSALWELEEIFEGVLLERISVSLQWTTIAAIVGFAAYVAMAERRGLNPSRLRGSIYNDPIHAHFCTYELSSPLRLGIKLAVDIVEYSVRQMSLWHPVVPGGYEMREWGISAAHELAFTLAIVLEYVQAARERGLNPDDFLPRMVFSMSVEMDLFEEVAKFRAARRVWARFSKERLGAKDPRSHRLKISAKTSGSSLTAQQPINNVVRTTVEALAAILGGVQVIEPCGYDEAFTIPSEEAATVALHLQHILHHEARLTNTVDPLGGSYFVERLTNEIEEEAWEIFRKIEERGGIVSSIEKGWLREEVKREAVRCQREVDEGRQVIVGLNGYVLPKEEEIPLKIHRDRRLEGFSWEQEERIRQFREGRDPERWREALDRLSERAGRGEGENLVAPVLEALKAEATLGEILGVIREAYGLPYDPFDRIAPLV